MNPRIREVFKARTLPLKPVTDSPLKPSVFVGKAPYVELGIVLIALAAYEHVFSQDASGGQLFNLWMF